MLSVYLSACLCSEHNTHVIRWRHAVLASVTKPNLTTVQRRLHGFTSLYISRTFCCISLCFIGSVGLGEYTYYEFHLKDDVGGALRQPLRFTLFSLDSSDLDMYITFKNMSSSADPALDIPGRQSCLLHLISSYLRTHIHHTTM